MENKNSKYCLLFKAAGRRFLVLSENGIVYRLQNKEHILRCLTKFINQTGDRKQADEALKMLDPIAIVAPAKFDELKKYLDGNGGYEISNDAMGMSFTGASVKESIMKLKSKLNLLCALRMDYNKSMN